MDEGVLLTIDTSTKVSSIGLFQGRKLLVSTYIDRNIVKGENLILLIGELLKKSGKNKLDINKVAVGIGPGSFTGIRVALSIAKSISYSSGALLKGVTSMDAVAIAFKGCSSLISPMISASSQGFFVSLYDVKDSFEQIEKPRYLALEEWIRFLNANYDNKNIILLSDRALDVNSFPIVSNHYEVLISHPTPLAESLMELFYIYFERGLLDDPLSLVPLYLRPSAAEERLIGS